MNSKSPLPEGSRTKNPIARHAPTVIRILMGLAFLVFGLNVFLNFFPPPPPLPERAAAFTNALLQTGYMMPLIAVTQLIVGSLLLLNRFVPLALLLLAPFLVNSLCFHFALEPSGRIMAVIFSGLELYLAWVYRKAYSLILTPSATLS